PPAAEENPRGGRRRAAERGDHGGDGRGAAAGRRHGDEEDTFRPEPDGPEVVIGHSDSWPSSGRRGQVAEPDQTGKLLDAWSGAYLLAAHRRRELRDGLGLRRDAG